MAIYFEPSQIAKIVCIAPIKIETKHDLDDPSFYQTEHILSETAWSIGFED